MRTAMFSLLVFVAFSTQAQSVEYSKAVRFAMATSDVADAAYRKSLQANERASLAVSEIELSRLKLKAELCSAQVKLLVAQEEVDRLESELTKLIKTKAAENSPVKP